MADLSDAFGVTLDGWQEVVLEASMGERADATWSARRVGLSVPRQNGKSQLLVARALAGALLFGEQKIVISAHQQDTARESFGKLMEIIDSDANASLRSRVKSVMNALNRESVKFTNGATIQFKARSGAGTRGFSSDCLMLDEAQILSQRAWVSINSTMSAMPNPQVWLLGTPPTPEDDGEVFGSVRSSAIDGKSTAVAWLEWAADPKAADFDPASEYTRWSANPAWNVRMNHEVVQGEFETYPPDRFALDRLGIWATEGAGTREISADEWASLGVNEAPQGVKSFGVAFSVDGSRVAVGGSRLHEGGVHVELVGAHSGEMSSGVAALADWLAERWRDAAQIVISGRTGAPALEQALRQRGVPAKVLILPSTGQYLAACSMTLDAVRDKTLTHLATDGQAALDESVAVCDRKKRAVDGAWGWEATTPDGDETPLEAVSLALWAAKTSKRRPGQRQEVI